MEFIGYACAIVIGLIMGLTGAGGAILTVPVLVYLLGMDPVTATGYSLLIVGTTAAFGTFSNMSKGLVNVGAGFRFALPSLIGVYAARKFIVPAIPEIIFETNSILITKGAMLMAIFAVIMLFASLAMLNDRTVDERPHESKGLTIVSMLKLLLAGLVVGMVGAGGGFLFVPILIYVAGLPIKKAAATSLMIIAINSLIGFTGDIGNIVIDWKFVLIFIGFAIAGIFIGISLNKFVNEKQLKKGFGWFVLTMSVVIFIREVVL